MTLSLSLFRQKITKPSLGFSLIELLMVIAVLAIILAFAVPNMRQMILNNRIKAVSNTLVTALNMARNEAITRKTEIQFCSAKADGTGCDSTAAYKHGAIIRADSSNVIYRTESLSADVTITTTTLNDIRIKSSGAPINSGDFFITGKGDINRTICIGTFGQIRIFDGKAVKNADGTIKNEKASCS